MDFWNQESTAQRLINSFAQFKKVDWHKDYVSKFKPSEIQVLFCIKKLSKGQDITVSDISKQLHVTSPTVTQIINGLEERGVVERRKSKEDRRSIKIFLTNKGEIITEQAAKNYASSINGLIDYLGDNQSEQLIELLNRVFIYCYEVKDR